ncbi:4Fe-4S dicluster-binding protein [Thermogladius sp. 4427co]|uniref:4Fe-4S dicluster-binding protein n=1 Tax=Thermogladius sp. 4427co TaxID=3450718 RepID=UPI003F78EA11
MPSLEVEIAGLKFKNPLMNAACPVSRDAESMIALINNNVGGVVAKTISVKPAIVPRPSMAAVDRGMTRMQMLKTIKPGDIRIVNLDSGNNRFIYGVLNAELWSDIPAEHYLEREYPIVREYARKNNVVFIASIGYTPEELSNLGPKVEKAGVDAIEFSTHYIGKDYKPVVEAAKALRESVSIPIFAKLSPFTPNIPELVKELENVGVNGIVATNTIGPALSIDVETGMPIVGGPYGFGWLSGPALKPLALAIVAQVALNTKLPVIGVGGISRGVDVIEYFMAGASAVQICTAALIEGPGVFKRILKEVEEWLARHDYDSILDIKGLALKYLKPEPRRVWAEPPIVDAKKCIGCGFCEQVCNYSAVHVVPDEKGKRIARVDIEKCYGCGLCTSVCPTRAIAFKEYIK